MIVLFYAVGCIAFGFTVGITVMMIDKQRARRKKNADDAKQTNVESKVSKTRRGNPVENVLYQ